jgi:nucleoside-diphosphate-sugar epimerase
MRILVTGATGNIASALIPRLVEEGHTVRALVRPTSKAEVLKAWPVELYRGDLTKPESLRGLGDGVDAAYHLGGALWTTNVRYLHAANVNGTGALATLLADRQLSRFIFTSFPQVLGPADRAMPEDADPHPLGNHARWKLEAEHWLLAMHRERKFPVTILRLGTVYGPGMQIIELYRRLLRWRLMATFGWGRYLTHFVHIDDVVAALLLALENEHAVGRVYHVCDDQPVPHRVFVNAMADSLGVTHPLPMPVPVFRAAAAAAGLGERLTGRAPFLTQDAITMAMQPTWADTSRIKAELGFAPLYPTIARGLTASRG